MINSNKFCSQLDQLKATLSEKHPELVNRKCIIFHQDNARPLASLMTRQKVLQLGWEVPNHLLYSPDITLLDFPFISVFTKFSYTCVPPFCFVLQPLGWFSHSSVEKSLTSKGCKIRTSLGQLSGFQGQYHYRGFLHHYCFENSFA